MYIKQLIKDERSYWEFVWPFIEWAGNPNLSLWREEDLPKLEPFFKDGRNDWTPEVKESFEFYEKCRKEYGDKNRELRDSVRHFSPEHILEPFGYEVPEYDDSDDGVDYTKDNPLPLDKEFEGTFPFVVTGDINCGFDRLGDISVISLYMVSLKDFAS